MKQPSDKFTIDAFEKSARGQSRKPNAKSSVQLQREFRQRQKFNFLISVWRNGNSQGVTQ